MNLKLSLSLSATTLVDVGPERECMMLGTDMHLSNVFEAVLVFAECHVWHKVEAVQELVRVQLQLIAG